MAFTSVGRLLAFTAGYCPRSLTGKQQTDEPVQSALVPLDRQQEVGSTLLEKSKKA